MISKLMLLALASLSVSFHAVSYSEATANELVDTQRVEPSDAGAPAFFEELPGEPLQGPAPPSCRDRLGTYTGIQRGTACCSILCGSCGGTGCSKRNGGAANCCTSDITDKGLFCSSGTPAGCLLR
jgi:hypothetical protein